MKKIPALLFLSGYLFSQCGGMASTTVLPCGALDPFGYLGSPILASVPLSYTIVPFNQDFIGISIGNVSTRVLPDDTMSFNIIIDDSSIAASVNNGYTYVFGFMKPIVNGVFQDTDFDEVPLVEWEIPVASWSITSNGRKSSTVSISLPGFYPFASLRVRPIGILLFIVIPTNNGSYLCITSKWMVGTFT